MRALLSTAFLAVVLTLAGCDTGTPDRGAGAPATGNLLTNGSFEVWSDGEPPQLPDQWRLVEWEGASQIGRETAAGDVHDGTRSLRLAAGEGVVSLVNTLALGGSAYGRLRGQVVTAGVWAKANEPGAAFITIRHGHAEAPVEDHPGDGTWQFITVTDTVAADDDAVSVRVGNRIRDGKTVVFFDGAVLVAGSEIPAALAGH